MKPAATGSGFIERCWPRGLRIGSWTRPASRSVNRRARRAQTDRLDALKLVTMLVRVCSGERRVWREVHVPTVAAEAARHVSRERPALTQDQPRLVNQMRGWLATWGTTVPARRRGAWWTTVRDWAGAALPAAVHARLARAEARLAGLAAQIAELEAQQQAAVTASTPAAVQQLVRLKGVATTSASVLLDEGLVWRAFRNRREIGGLLGFAPTPDNSGDSIREHGISRAGNARLQAISIQLAWNGVRWQPQSALTQWYQANFGNGKRARRVRFVKGRAPPGRPPRRGYRRTRVRDRDCTVSWGRARGVRARIEDEDWVMDPDVPGPA